MREYLVIYYNLDGTVNRCKITSRRGVKQTAKMVQRRTIKVFKLEDVISRCEEIAAIDTRTGTIPDLPLRALREIKW